MQFSTSAQLKLAREMEILTPRVEGQIETLTTSQQSVVETQGILRKNLDRIANVSEQIASTNAAVARILDYNVKIKSHHC